MSKKTPEIPRHILHSSQINVPPEHWMSLECLGQYINASVSAIAFNYFRKVQEPGLGLPPTGLSGYLLGFYSIDQVKTILEAQEALLQKKIDNLPIGLKSRVKKTLQGSDFHRDANSWLVGELGSLLSRLHAARFEVEGWEKKKGDNSQLYTETYQALASIPPELRVVLVRQQMNKTLVEYPFPWQDKRNGNGGTLPTLESLGRFGLPVYRAIAEDFDEHWMGYRAAEKWR